MCIDLQILDSATDNDLQRDSRYHLEDENEKAPAKIRGLKAISNSLFEKEHPSRLRALGALKPVEVDSRGNLVTRFIPAIPDHAVLSGT